MLKRAGVFLLGLKVARPSLSSFCTNGALEALKTISAPDILDEISTESAVSRAKKNNLASAIE